MCLFIGRISLFKWTSRECSSVVLHLNELVWKIFLVNTQVPSMYFIPENWCLFPEHLTIAKSTVLRFEIVQFFLWRNPYSVTHSDTIRFSHINLAVKTPIAIWNISLVLFSLPNRTDYPVSSHSLIYIFSVYFIAKCRGSYGASGHLCFCRSCVALSFYWNLPWSSYSSFSEIHLVLITIRYRAG